jgi:hypothetical protein
MFLARRAVENIKREEELKNFSCMYYIRKIDLGNRSLFIGSLQSKKRFA